METKVKKSTIHKSSIIVPTHLWGEELYTQMGFFLFSQFWPIDIFIVEKCEWCH